REFSVFVITSTNFAAISGFFDFDETTNAPVTPNVTSFSSLSGVPITNSIPAFSINVIIAPVFQIAKVLPSRNKGAASSEVIDSFEMNPFWYHSLTFSNAFTDFSLLIEISFFSLTISPPACQINGYNDEFNVFEPSYV